MFKQTRKITYPSGKTWDDYIADNKVWYGEISNLFTNLKASFVSQGKIISFMQLKEINSCTEITIFDSEQSREQFRTIIKSYQNEIMQDDLGYVIEITTETI